MVICVGYSMVTAAGSSSSRLRAKSRGTGLRAPRAAKLGKKVSRRWTTEASAAPRWNTSLLLNAAVAAAAAGGRPRSSPARSRRRTRSRRSPPTRRRRARATPRRFFRRLRVHAAKQSSDRRRPLAPAERAARRRAIDVVERLLPLTTKPSRVRATRVTTRSRQADRRRERSGRPRQAVDAPRRLAHGALDVPRTVASSIEGLLTEAQSEPSVAGKVAASSSGTRATSRRSTSLVHRGQDPAGDRALPRGHRRSPLAPRRPPHRRPRDSRSLRRRGLLPRPRQRRRRCRTGQGAAAAAGGGADLERGGPTWCREHVWWCRP